MLKYFKKLIKIEYLKNIFVIFINIFLMNLFYKGVEKFDIFTPGEQPKEFEAEKEIAIEPQPDDIDINFNVDQVKKQMETELKKIEKKFEKKLEKVQEEYYTMSIIIFVILMIIAVPVLLF